MTEEYVIWQHALVPNACALDSLEGFDDDYLLAEGVKLEDEFPSDVYFKMDPDSPHDTLLVDSLYNTHSELIFSQKLKNFICDLGLNNVEFLPVKIMDHKGKFVAEPYFIFNVLEHQDCLNIEESGAELPRLKTMDIMDVEKLVLDEDKFDHSLDIFRVKRLPTATVVKKSLADKIDAMGFSAIDWVSLDEFDGSLY
jgi:hypothetical protein